MNFIERIKAAFELYFAIKPQVVVLVNEAEGLFVGAGRGKEKLKYVTDCISAVLTTTDAVAGIAQSVLSIATPFIAAYVASQKPKN